MIWIKSIALYFCGLFPFIFPKVFFPYKIHCWFFPCCKSNNQLSCGILINNFTIRAALLWTENLTDLNPSRPDPGQREKMNLNFYVHTSLWCLKRFYEGLKAFIKIFKAPQRSRKWKFKLIFILIQFSEMNGAGRVNLKNLTLASLEIPTQEILKLIYYVQ